MKRLLSPIIIAVFILSFYGCSGKSSSLITTVDDKSSQENLDDTINNGDGNVNSDQQLPAEMPTPSEGSADTVVSAVSEGIDSSGSQNIKVADATPFGQQDMYSSRPNNAKTEESSLSWPRSIAVVGEKWILSDTGNHRILIFNGGLGMGTPIVLGHEYLDAGSRNNGLILPSASTLNAPAQVASDGTKLIVADFSNNRVLIWNKMPERNFEPADVVIGQADFSGMAANKGQASPSADSLYWPMGITVTDGKLIVSDYLNSRILVFNSIPTRNGASADVVIGQADFSSKSANRGSASPSDKTLSYPGLLSSFGGRLIVSDAGNSRVLIWDTTPTEPNIGANLVIGQGNFVTGRGNRGGAPSINSLNYPYHALVVGAGLYVADSGNSRILYYASFPTVNGQDADGVIGQPDFASGLENRTGSRTPYSYTLSFPSGLHSDGTSLWVADSGNSRILKFDTLPTNSSALANGVYGQTSTDTGFANQTGPNAGGFSWPTCIEFYGQYLVTCEQDNERCLVFNRETFDSGPISVIGQPDFESYLVNQGKSVAANTFNLHEPDCAVDSAGRLYISDADNNRVLVFNRIPTSNNASADFVIGQPDFASNTANNGTGNQKFYRPVGLHISFMDATGEEKLFVSDYWNNRILIFNLPIRANHRPAEFVVGQPDFDTLTGGRTDSKISIPVGIFSDGTKLIITDDGNRRVLVWNQIPAVSGAKADIVIGQADFTAREEAISAKRFSAMIGNHNMELFNGLLLIPDRFANRILAFAYANLATDMPATYVFGQDNFTSEFWLPSNESPNKVFGGFSGPQAVKLDPSGNYIWVVDKYNHRILKFTTSGFMDLATD